jgi:hypothetical protein
MSHPSPGRIKVTRAADRRTPAADPARVLVLLKKRDASFVARWITLAILGFLVLWVGPLVVGTIAFLARMREHQTPWLTCFLCSCLIVLPILFFFEWLTRGKFFDNTVETLGDLGGYGVYGGMYAYAVRGRLAVGAMAVEICLWGPRMVIAGFRRIAALARVKPTDHAPAANVLAQLLRQEEGLPTATVMTGAQLDPDTFSHALAYLTFHEITDISKDGSRLWVLSEARKKLLAAASS